MAVYFRQYKEQDFEALEDIVRKTWHYDDLCSPKTAKQLARVFLTSCLTNYTFSRVAIVDGEVQGRDFGQRRGEPPANVSKSLAAVHGDPSTASERGRKKSDEHF